MTKLKTIEATGLLETAVVDTCVGLDAFGIAECYTMANRNLEACGFGDTEGSGCSVLDGNVERTLGKTEDLDAIDDMWEADDPSDLLIEVGHRFVSKDTVTLLINALGGKGTAVTLIEFDMGGEGSEFIVPHDPDDQDTFYELQDKYPQYGWVLQINLPHEAVPQVLKESLYETIVLEPTKWSKDICLVLKYSVTDEIIYVWCPQACGINWGG